MIPSLQIFGIEFLHKLFKICLACYMHKSSHNFYSVTSLIIGKNLKIYEAPGCEILSGLFHYHRHLPPWIRSFDLFRHRRVAIVSWGVCDSHFHGVCSWGHISGVWCCPFFRGGWSSFVCMWVSRLVFQRSVVFVLCLRFLFCPVLCIL